MSLYYGADGATPALLWSGFKAHFSTGIECIGFEYRRCGGGDVLFGHLAPVIQYVALERQLRTTLLQLIVLPDLILFHVYALTTLPQAVLSLFPVCGEPRINPFLSRRH